jgi:hypothetical protein
MQASSNYKDEKGMTVMTPRTRTGTTTFFTKAGLAARLDHA